MVAALVVRFFLAAACSTSTSNTPASSSLGRMAVMATVHPTFL